MIDLYECDIYHSEYYIGDDIYKEENKIKNIVYIDENFAVTPNYTMIKIEYITEDNELKTIIDRSYNFKFVVKREENKNENI